MASKVMVMFLVLSVAVLPSSTLAADYTVCANSGGWVVGADILGWLKGLTFHVGDTLHFDFNAPQTVAVVDLAGFLACDASKAITIDTSGSFTYKITKTGSLFFISTGINAATGILDCAAGLKLQVYVV